jgi:uncharacterized protein
MTPNTQQTGSAAVLDGGPHARELTRLCVATHTVRPVADLIRFVVGPNGEAVPDIKGKLPGRGVWVTATRGAVAEAIKRKAFSRGFRRDIRVPADLVAKTEGLLESTLLDALAIAGKSGLVAAGFGKTEGALAHRDVVAVIHAADASPDGVRKLDAALRQRQMSGPVSKIQILTSAQLDLALGRPNVVHAALLAGRASDTVMARLRRLERFRAGDLDLRAGTAPN